MLFLVGCGLFKKASATKFPRSHWVGLMLSLAVFAAGPSMTLLVQNVLAALILVIVAIREHRSLGGTASLQN